MFLFIKTLDPEPHNPKMLDPDPHSKQGEYTMLFNMK